MKAMLHDVSRCTGCMQCVETCSLENGLVRKGADVRFKPGDLSAKRFTTLKRTREGRYVRQQCLHCLEPSCAAACLVGALTRREDGQVVYDATRCIGCRYCMLACPVHVIRYQWDTPMPFVQKCDLCYDRKGGPACAEACPYDVSIYGERDELLEIAHARIRSNPDQYEQKVWGEYDMGGTAVMFISDTPLDALWPESLGNHSIPSITWPIANKTPFLALGVAGFLTGASWLIGRRNRIAAEQAEAHQAPIAAEEEQPWH